MEVKVKTKVKVSNKTIARLVVENNESTSAMGLAFNHLQDIVLKSIESMNAISPESTIQFVKGINETVLPSLNTSADEYKKAVIESIESLEVEVLGEEEYNTFMEEMRKKKEETMAMADGSKKASNGIVETTWE